MLKFKANLGTDAKLHDPENRPMTITKGGITTTFYYDGNGARIKKTSGGATTIYIGKLYECTNGICDKEKWCQFWF